LIRVVASRCSDARIDRRSHPLIGRRQVTAYLAELARRHGGGLAIFDEGLAQLHVDVAQLVSLH